MKLSELETKAPKGAFSLFDMEILIEAVEKIPKNGVYLEIGVDKGRSLWVAREHTKPSVEVIGIDVRPDPKIKGTLFFQMNSKGDAGVVNRGIDVLFIDGDHSYKGCKGDIENWIPLIKQSGVVLFHDCDESSPGVVQAVAEFVNTHTVKRWQLFKRTDKNTSMSRIDL